MDFMTAYHVYKNQHHVTARAAGFQSANTAGAFKNDTMDGFANLSTATVADRKMMADLTETNRKLLQQVIEQAKDIAELRKLLVAPKNPS